MERLKSAIFVWSIGNQQRKKLANNSDFFDQIERLDYILNFLRINVETAAYDHILFARHNLQMAIFVPFADVTRRKWEKRAWKRQSVLFTYLEITVFCELFFRLLRQLPIAFKNTRSANLDHIVFAKTNLGKNSIIKRVLRTQKLTSVPGTATPTVPGIRFDGS